MSKVRSLMTKRQWVHDLGRVDRRYLDLLRESGYDNEAWKVDHCKQLKALRYRCPEAVRDGSHNPFIIRPQSCSQYRLCDPCSRRKRNENTKRHQEAFRKGSKVLGIGRPEFIAMEFNVPHRLRPAVAEEDFTRLRKMIEVVLGSLFPGMFLGGIIAVHYWHSSNPLQGGWFPHVHVMLSTTAKDKKTGRWMRLRKFVDVRRMRYEWIRVLEREFQGWLVDRSNGDPAKTIVRSTEIDVNTHYSRGTYKAYHRLTYMLRDPIQDVRSWVAKGGEWDSRGISFLQRIVGRPRSKQNYAGFGWFGKAVIRKNMKEMNQEWVTKSEWVKEERKKARMCPFHPKTELQRDGWIEYEDWKDEVVIGYTRAVIAISSIHRSGGSVSY